MAEPKASWLIKFPSGQCLADKEKPREAMSSTAATFILQFCHQAAKTTAPIKPP